MRSIKFTPSGNTTDYSFSVVTPRIPVWGDFYAKDGKDNRGTIDVAIWNNGFTSPDSDPLDVAANGSVQNHILRPDTNVVREDPVPEPASMLLLSLGGAAAIRRARKRSA